MVRYQLQFTADLQNLITLEPSKGADDPDFVYSFKMKCGNCGEVKEKGISMTSDKRMSGLRRAPNFEMKCKICERIGTVTVINGIARSLSTYIIGKGTYAPLIQLNCDGFEPFDYVFGNGWKAKSMAGTIFDNIDLSDGEFCEYDEVGKCPVMISNLSATFEVMMSEVKEHRLARSEELWEWHKRWSERARARKKAGGF